MKAVFHFILLITKARTSSSMHSQYEKSPAFYNSVEKGPVPNGVREYCPVLTY